MTIVFYFILSFFGSDFENIVAIDGIAVIADKGNKINDITAEDLKKVYKGEIKNWSELGGDDIKVIATGGLSVLIASETDSIDYVDKFLTLEGLRLIYDKNIE